MTTNRPKLSVCLIVRDSARTLPACLVSIRPWVDEIVVVDTGSLDNTRQIAQGYGGKVSDFPWIDDFSAARNESFRLASGEWLFWMDSDDTIDEANGRALRDLAYGEHTTGVLGYVVQVHCPGDTSRTADLTVVDHVKLVRNDPRIRFEGRIHEQILPSIRRLGGEVGWTELFVVHSGSDQSPEGKQRKYERDLRILRLDLAERPDHPFVHFNLGMTYADMDDHPKAEHWLRRCLELSNSGESHVRKAYALLIGAMHRQGNLDEAAELCRRGLELFPKDIELLFRWGIIAHELGRFEEAVAAYKGVLCDQEPRHFTSIDRGLAGHKARHNLALVLSDRGDHALAEVSWRQALGDQPDFEPGLRGLGQALISQGRLTAAELLVERLGQDGARLADKHWLEALLAEQHGHASLVRSYLEKALAVDPNHVPARRDLCRWLFHRGSLDEAASALGALAQRLPDDPAAWHNLGVILARQGRLDDAEAALRRSIELRPAATTTQAELEHVQNRRLHERENSPPKGTAPTNAEQAVHSAAVIELPACRARRRIPGVTDRFHCLHPQVFAPDHIVTPSMCRSCSRWPDAPREYAQPASQAVRPNRGLSCKHFGAEIGQRDCPSCRGSVQVKVFACSHPARKETTLADCQSCPDYSEAVQSEQSELAAGATT